MEIKSDGKIHIGNGMIDTLLFVVEFVLCIQLTYLNHLNVRVVNALIILCALAEIVVLLLSARSSVMSVSLNTRTWITLFVAFQTIVSLINSSQDLVSCLKDLFLVFLTVVAIGRRIFKSRNKYVHILAVLYWIVILVNLITVILYLQTGIYKAQSISGTWHPTYLIGTDNKFGRLFFPGFAIIWFDQESLGKRNSFLTLSAIIMIIATYIIKLNGTGVILCVILVFYYVVFVMNKHSLFYSNRLFVFLMFLFCLIIVFGGTLFSNGFGIFGNLFGFLGKDVTLSGRIYIWRECLQLFFQRPLFGFGKSDSGAIVLWMGRTFNAHNIVLQIMVENGIIGLLLFGSVVLSSFKLSRRIEISFLQIKIITVGIFLAVMYYSMEVGNMNAFYILLMIPTFYKEYVSEVVPNKVK